MKLYAPKYYKSFVCIADRCKHSCCVGWEIDVDGETFEKYSSLKGGYGERIKKSIDASDTPHFILRDGDRCPHLNEKGLCNIILNLGEDHLCHICRNHPRFYNYTSYGKEVGLGLSCEEACRIILSSDDYREIVCLCDTDEVDEVFDTDFDPIAHRERLFSILADASLTFEDKIRAIEDEYRVSPSQIPDPEWQYMLSSLEYLNDGNKCLFAAYSSETNAKPKFEKECERALAYLIFRHCAEAYDLTDLRVSLGFCLFVERLIRSVAISQSIQSFEDFCDIARTVSEEIEYSEDNTDEIKLRFEDLVE